jgi:hypothetical protein
MPKIDKMTGCSVMTLPEFWSAEAAAEGKGRSGGDIAEDFYNEMAKEEEAERQRFFEPASLVRHVNSAIAEYDDDPEARYGFKVTTLLDLHEDQDFSSGLRGSEIGFTAKFTCDDGKERWLNYSEWSDHGSRWDPPDGGREVTVITDEKKLAELE